MMRADEAFLLFLQQKALADPWAGRTFLKACEKHRAAQPKQPKFRSIVYSAYSGKGDVDRALRALGLATLRDPYRPTANLALNPLVVQYALDRLGDRRLTPAEQDVVFAATRMPHKVRWPDWWMRQI